MGIKGLNDLLRKVCPDVFEPIHISEYAYKKVAVDTSLYLQTFKASRGSQWLSAFIRFVACLRNNELHCVFIYDTGAPPEKEKEREERAASRDKRNAKVEQLEDDFATFQVTGRMSEELEKFYNKFDPPKPMSLLGNSAPRTIKTELLENMVKEERAKISISSADFEITKKLFDILNVPWYDAPQEAETICSDLCKRGLVDAVLSRDTDVLAYGSTTLISDINTITGVCQQVRHSRILEEMEMTEHSFLDLCIMCGTDYNKNIFRIGPMISYKLIKQHKNIEGVRDNTAHDISILNHERSRELFTEYEKLGEDIPYCAPPNFEELKKFAACNNVDMDVDTLRACFLRKKVTIIEDESEEEYQSE